MRFKKSKDVLARARGENPRLTVADNKLIVCNVRAQARKGLRFCAFIAADLAGRRVDISSIPNQSLRPVSLQSPVESRDRDQWQAGPTGEPKCETVVLRRLRGREGRGMMLGVSFDQMIACAKRELGIRRKFYPRWIQNGTMDQETADKEIHHMEAILAYLEQQAGRRRSE
jgi:hypothetical protein